MERRVRDDSATAGGAPPLTQPPVTVGAAGMYKENSSNTQWLHSQMDGARMPRRNDFSSIASIDDSIGTAVETLRSSDADWAATSSADSLPPGA